MKQRTSDHQRIRDDPLAIFAEVCLPTRRPQVGSYIFPT